VFRRVADYDWADLIGAPHKIIRHDEMPKGVFYILWDRILKGQPIGAYVKNRARDGLYYWVFAVVTPCEEGFLSARIKPTSARRETVEALYADLRAQELDGTLTAESSAQKIEETVRGLGFDSYEDFAADSLTEELLAEAGEAGWPAPGRIVAARDLLGTVHDLSAHADALLSAFGALTAVPRNLQIKAKRIEPTGGPLTALSADYGRMSQDMSVWFLEKVVGRDNNFNKICAAIKHMLLFGSTREILGRCHQQLHRDVPTQDQFDADRERCKLEALITDYTGQIAEEFRQLDAQTARLSRACADMQRSLLGLNTVRVTGKIENARLVGDSSSLGEIIAHLGTSQALVERHLDAVKLAVDEICRGVKRAQGLERRSERDPSDAGPWRKRIA
jgi:aerotaxis receptor